MIKFVYGAPGSGKTHYVFECLKEDHENALLIVPEQQTVICERKALEFLPESSQLTFEVLNFSRLCNKVFRLFGGLSYHYIGSGMKSLFMWRTLRELAPLLEEYKISGNEMSMTPLMLASVSELKNYSISPDRLEKAAEELPDDAALRGKVRDIALICASYTNLVKQSFDDASDDLKKLCEIVGRENFFEGKKVYIDSFSSFTAPELDIIKRIFEQAQDVTVTLGCESPRVRLIGSESLIGTAKKLEGLAEKLGKKTEHIYLTQNRRASNKELSEIGNSLWSFGTVKSVGESIPESERGNIRVINCKNAYSEADAVVGIIHSQLRRGLRYRDIAVIARDISTRRGILDAALENADIPYFMSRSSDLAAKPVVRLISSALRAKIYGLRADDIMANLGTGLYPIERKNIDLFSQYIGTWNISGKGFLCDWSMNPDGYTEKISERGKNILAAANTVRKELVGRLEKLFTQIDAAENTKDICRAIFSYLECIGLSEHLRLMAKDELCAGHRREAADILAVWNLMINILDDIASALGDEKLTAEEFLQAFMLEISASDIGAIPTGYDEVTLGSASLLRTDNIKCAILVGLNDDEFPKSVSDDGIFSQADRNLLEKLGIEVSSSLGERTSEEYLYARRAISAPSDSLYMLYCNSSTAGKTLRPSPIIGRVLSLFDYIKPESYEKLPLELALTAPSVAADRLPELERSEQSEALRELLVERGQISADRKISAPECTVSPETAEEIFGKYISLTQTKIDKFVLCAFNYYCEEILKLRNDDKAEVGFNIMGSFIHSLLENFVKLAADGEDFDLSVFEENTENIADGIISELIEKICPPEKKDSDRMAHLFLRLRRIALLVLKNLGEEFSKSSFRPEFFELRIGAEGAPPPLSFVLNDGTRVVLNGIIDRVDIMRRDGDIFLRVIDYKTGSKEFSLSDIKEGLNLQLLIYIFSLSQKNTEFAKQLGCAVDQAPIPVAAHYLSSAISQKKLDAPKSREEILDDASSRLSRSGVYRNDPGLLSALNSDLNKSMLGGISSKDGEVFTGRGLVDPDDFDGLYSELERTVCDIASEMKSGRADAKTRSENLDEPCEYCKMRSVCRKSTKRRN